MLTCLYIDEKISISPYASFLTVRFLSLFLVIPSASVISRAETTNAVVDKTVIYWNSETAIEKVSCEMRYKATTNHTWNVS
jgi:hypothetical protein